MASVIEGYNYDIFISYRQKDNKYDGWVTEFVDNLKKELEATFKEEISVYFDINPHDGLLETHDVDESLKDKLKCLIFIPIISRTYCDPKSFAWEHEFKAFVELASKDRFELKIKLPNGNVASRVLPVQIHDLDADDKKLCDAVLGGFTRGLEFIYKEPGVDRPLTTKDNEEKNLNKTSYRNQINKVALAIKEILSAIKHKEQKSEPVPAKLSGFTSIPKRNNKIKIITGTFIALLLIILGILFIPKLIKPKEQVEKSIAVLPFRNLTNDSTQLYFCDGFMEEILNNLQKINSFSVRSRTSSDLYRDTKKPITVIGKELNANYLIEGSVGREGNTIKIWVYLFDARTDKHIWSNEYLREITIDQIFSLQSEIARSIAGELKAVLTPKEIEEIGKKPTENLEAYNLYLKGRYFWNFRTETDLLKAIDCFNEAIKMDSTYALAYTGLADSYIMLPWYSSPANDIYLKAEEAAKKALRLNYLLGEAYATMGFIKYSKWEFDTAEEDFIKALELNPNYPQAHLWYAMLLACTARFDKAIDEILIARYLDPLGLVINRNTGFIYISAKQYDKGIEFLKKVIDIEPNFISVHYQLARAYLNKGMYEDALYESQVEGVKIWTGIIYANMGQLDKAQQILNEIIISSKSQIISSFELAILNFSLGNEEQGFNNLETAYDVHDLRLTEIRMYPELDKYLSNPRFRSILKKMGIKN